MKKIAITKNEEAAAIVEKVIETDAQEITLIVPRFSRLVDSLSNFQLLQREAVAAKKSVEIESVDDRVLEMAELSGLKATNPFLSKDRRQFSDIVSSGKKESPSQKRSFFKKDSKFAIKNAADVEAAIQSLELPPLDIDPAEAARQSHGYVWLMPMQVIKQFRKFPWKLAIIIGIFAVSSWAAVTILPRADIQIIAKKTEWPYQDSILADKAAKLDSKNMTIPNQVFTQKKNAELRFPATGKKMISKKATGRVSISNAYSSAAQSLVINTRFMAPDGKVFRLVNTIVVPGAKIEEGKIVPSHIDADVIADAPGPDWNIGPVKLFTIPGFKNTPKYQSFYGESVAAMAGGFVGEAAYPTDSDLATAKQKANQTLQDALKTDVLAQIPKGFKVLDGSINFSVVKQTIKDTVDKDNQFSIYTETQMTVLSFREEDALSVLTQRAINEKGADAELRSTDLQYGIARSDFKAGKLSFLVDFKASFASRIDQSALVSRILGKPEIDLKSTIFSLPGLDSAHISLWPFWVKTVPTDPEKIKIVID